MLLDSVYEDIKIELISFKSSEHINEKGNGPYHGFGFLSLFSDPTDLTTWSQREYCNFASFSTIVDTKTIKVEMGPNIY